MKGENRPVKAPKTDLEPRSLPQKPEFIAALNQYGLMGDKVWKVMDSKGKFRRHRNEIAHVGKRFVNEVMFHDLCFCLETLIADVYDGIQSNTRGKMGRRE